ncbi:hypothetical protein QF002_000546 [Paraburkholderia youngii]
MQPVIVRICAIPLPALWGGAPARPQSSPEWLPFTGEVPPNSIAYALSVQGALFRWLIEQRYVLAEIRFPSQLSDALVPVFSQ